MPCSASARRPRGVIQSLDHAGVEAHPDRRVEPGVLEPVHQVVAHRGHRRAAGVRRGDRHDDVLALERDRSEDAEVLQREHRHFRVRDRGGQVCCGAGRQVADAVSHSHHRPVGWARATDCISASRCEKASVWRPWRPVPPFDRPHLRQVGAVDVADREHLLEQHGDLVGHRRRIDARRRPRRRRPRCRSRRRARRASATPGRDRPAAGSGTRRCPRASVRNHRPA